MKNFSILNFKFSTQSGFSIVEIIIAVAIFLIFASGSVGVVLQAFQSNRLSSEYTVANQFASEGLEAVRSIKNQTYCNIMNMNSTGIDRSTSNVWEITGEGTNDVLDKYTRTIKVESVDRLNGDIVSSGGTNDSDTKKITSSVSWNHTSARPESIDLVTYLTNWRKSIPPAVHGGMLVYGNGGTTTDAMVYRVLDGSTGLWGAATAMPDFDGGSINSRAVRSVRLYASHTRNEKIALVRRYKSSNPREQTIWAYIWNGISWTSTGTPFATWSTTTNLDVRNFDGTYLENGNFMAVYSDNTSIPKYRIWDGCSWSTQSSLVNLANNGSGTPLYIVAKARPGTNEVMTVFFGVAQDTNTQYYDGNSWTLHSRHSSSGPASKEMIDFSWSPNSPTKGALIYPESTTDNNITIKIWTANGTGGGSWSSAVNASNQGILGAMSIDGRFGGDEFLACSKDASNDIYCFKSTTTPSWQTPTNNILTTTTQTGIQRSYDFVYELLTGTNGLAVYSINSNAPQRRIYTPGASPAFSTAANLLTTQLTGTLATVRTRAFQDSDDIMVLMGDSSNILYTVIWNGSSNAVYTTPSGKARTSHGTNGSATTDYWYDFAWDQF
jgi:prepilin-type N-terminal cleavage/methylation domain-containing protein